MPSKLLIFLIGFSITSSLSAQSPIDDYIPSQTYTTGSLVLVGQDSYIATTSVPVSTSPPNTTYWTNLSVAATALSIPVEDVPELTTEEILNSLPGSAPPGSEGNATGTPRIVRISVRGHIGTGDDERFMAFNLSGSGSVMLRACGPSLGLLDSSLSSVSLLDPYMRVSQYNDPSDLTKGSTEITASGNDNYGDRSESSTIASSSSSIFPYVAMQSTEAASISTLTAGYYSSNVRDKSYSAAYGSRIGWVSVDLTDTSGSAKFTSVATRGIVSPGDGAMFAAFEIVGDSSSKRKIFLRGRGASLASFGVKNVLSNTMLKLYQYNDTNDYSKGSTLVAENNDYTSQSNSSEIAAKAQALLAQPLSSSDPGMFVELGAGYYSIKFESQDGSSSGNGWIGIDDITE